MSGHERTYIVRKVLQRDGLVTERRPVLQALIEANDVIDVRRIWSATSIERAGIVDVRHNGLTQGDNQFLRVIPVNKVLLRSSLSIGRWGIK